MRTTSVPRTPAKVTSVDKGPLVHFSTPTDLDAYGPSQSRVPPQSKQFTLVLLRKEKEIIILAPCGVHSQTYFVPNSVTTKLSIRVNNAFTTYGFFTARL